MEFTEAELPRNQPEYHYDLDPEQMQLKIASLLERQPPPHDKEIVCYQLDDDTADVARTIECQVFYKAFNNDPTEMEKIYGQYEDASRFYLSIDQYTGRPVGALRVIDDSEVGSMTLNDLPEKATTKSRQQIMVDHNIDTLDTCWDIGTVAVLPEYRTKDNGVAVQLYRAMYVDAMKNDVSHILAIINKRVYDKMTGYLGIPFEQLSGTSSFDYEGSENNVAVSGYVPDFYSRMRRHSHSIKGMLARKALKSLVYGREDDAIMFDTRY